MKRISSNILTKFIGLVLFVGFVAACSDSDDDTDVLFSVDKNDITIAAEGGEEALVVEASHKWVATASEPWIMVSPANGIGTTECTVTVDSSLVSGIRTAIVQILSETGETAEVKVRQTGFGKVIVIEKPEDEIAASAKKEERCYEATVTANVPFYIEIEYPGGNEEWLSADAVELELDRGARPRTIKVNFNWKMNTHPEERVARVRFLPLGEDVELDAPALLTLTQKAAVRIEDNRQGDSIALLTIFERLNCMSDPWETGENMRNWRDVTLWEANDKDLPSPEAVGRVRSVEFFMFNTEESVPMEIKYLKYVESLSVSSNVNTMLKSIDLGSDICSLKYLKNLTLFSYGIVSLPDDFKNLGATLERLDLSANNLPEIPSVLTKENFPKLKSINLVANRRRNTIDIRRKEEFEDGIGLHIHTASDNSLRRLLLWDTLEELRLSNNYIEGELPDFVPGEEGVEAYTQADVDAFGGDTIQYLADNKIPRILPKMKSLSLNLNFFTGNLPQWLLYHPYLLEWYPELLIFNQQEQGRNSLGEVVRFDNAPSSFEYYYNVFPGMREKYELNDEITE